MQVIETIEQEDGGAVIKLDLTPEEVDLLVSYALKDILTKKAEEVIDE